MGITEREWFSTVLTCWI